MAPKGLLLTAEQFNLLVPVGRAMRYYPVAGDEEFEDTTTRSEAWELGDGSPVVKIVGRAGGVHLEHLELRQGERQEASAGEVEYWVEPHEASCPECGKDRGFDVMTWDADGQPIALGTTFDDKDDAEEEAKQLNEAFAAGAERERLRAKGSGS